MAKMTSGATQQGVPTNVLAGSARDAEPKSPSLTSPFPVMRMLAALISLRRVRGIKREVNGPTFGASSKWKGEIACGSCGSCEGRQVLPLSRQ